MNRTWYESECYLCGFGKRINEYNHYLQRNFFFTVLSCFILQIHVEVDGSHRLDGTTLGAYSILNMNTLYVGGGPNPLYNNRPTVNFKGCMKKVSNEMYDDILFLFQRSSSNLMLW